MQQPSATKSVMQLLRTLTAPASNRTWWSALAISAALAVGLAMASPAPSCAAVESQHTPISVNQTRGALLHIRQSPQISTFLWQVAREAAHRFASDGLSRKNLGIALILDGDQPSMGGYNDKQNFYPASVVKLCFAVALERDFAIGKIARSKAVLNDLDLMLSVSSNEAADRILDRLTDTHSGPRLPQDQLAAMGEKRQAVNKYLKRLGLGHINASQKTWNVKPYGRDIQLLGPRDKNANSMTPADTAKLLWLIKRHKVVSLNACDEILNYIRRVPGNPKDVQAIRIGGGIPASSQLWTKSGWTSSTNNDAAYVHLPFGGSFVLVVFTNTSYKHPDIISWIARQVTSGVQLDLIKPQPVSAQPRSFQPGAQGTK